ncbi:MAG TPA: transglutaminase domain-containing protein [Blastocatellia bacterium]|nr:transglutaminase domain-containing protein [Blastocatellia bacterium]
MSKTLLKYALSLLLAFFSLCGQSIAQNPNVVAREAEWRNYKLPESDFVRHVDASESVLFRAPVDWKKQGLELNLTGPDSAELRVVVEEVPDGIPLKSYVSALLQGLRDLPGGADSITVRRTQISGVEAREVMFEITDNRGVLSRRSIWCVVSGSKAVCFIFAAPLAQINKLEPYFKAVVQSAVIFRYPFEYTRFETTRAAAIKESKPARIDEVQPLIATLDGMDQTARAKAVSSLAAIFSSSPDSAIELTLDKRPMVRAAAIEAISLSGNKALSKFLLVAVTDDDTFVVERAAKAIARMPDPEAILRDVTGNWAMPGLQMVLNASAFLDQKTRARIVTELLKTPAAPIKIRAPIKIAAPKPPAKQPRAGGSKLPSLGSITVAMPDQKPEGFVGYGDMYINREFIALNLLRDIPASDLKMPFDQIVVGSDRQVIVAALQVALERGERLAVDSLLKLLASPNEEVRLMAAVSLGQSATAADIARIESHALKPSPQPGAKRAGQKPSGSAEEADRQAKRLADELQTTIKKIRLRERLTGADSDLQSQLIKEAMTDARLAEWVYGQYLREQIEGPRRQSEAQAPPVATTAKEKQPDRVISPLGENLFPANVRLYAALPNPGVALNKLGDSLRSLQMDSAQGQAHLVLMLSFGREQLARLFGSPHGEAMLDYLGIKLDAPVAMASWTAEGAPRGLATAERKAILVRVSDRDRFERLVALYQSRMGYVGNLPEYVSVGARFIGLAPAVLPLAALSGNDSAKEKKDKPLSFHLVGRDECNGYEVKVFERREVMQYGGIISHRVYLAYVGDAAVLAPDWHSLRECLTRLATGGASIAGNSEFKRAQSSGGDVIYLSNLGAVLDSFSGKTGATGDGFNIAESGALKISNGAWENSYNFSFKQSEWNKPLRPFHPAEAAAPRELLPRSTVIYFLTRFDAALAWRAWASEMFGADEIKKFADLWAIEFEKEVLPEIGPESGAALLGLPDLNAGAFNAPWVIYFKLKSDKLTRLASEGKLLKGITAATRSAAVKVGGADFFLSIQNGYLILSGSEAAIALLDKKEKLDGARDFARAAKAAPNDVIAFGGYNLDGVIQLLGDSPGDRERQRFITALTSIARAFHSQNFYARAASDGVGAQMSVSLDREGRYSVAELSSLSDDFQLTYASVEARGVAIPDQQHLQSLKLRIRAKSGGIIDRINADIASNDQRVEKRSASELIVTVAQRRAQTAQKVQLPVSDPALASFLKPTREIRSDDQTVIAQAREIAGEDRDAWSVTRKLADWTYKNLKWKRVDDADAAETLATREADCVEFSQLFVAMARSLGLPARIVSGLAYDGNSFGGHAWVEVYAGQWIELDPTWGTDFVDATHLKSGSDELLSYTALNAIEIEVLEATRGVADFQRDATTLAKKLCEELPQKRGSALAVALDIAALTDEYMGAGSWNSLNSRERERMSSAYRRLLAELTVAYASEGGLGEKMRLLKVTQTGDNAEALAIVPNWLGDMLLKFKLTRRADAWSISELIYLDLDLHVISESLRPAAQTILEQRNGKAASNVPMSEHARVALLLDEDAQAALELSDKALAADPESRRFKHLKALALLELEKEDEAVKLLTELSDEKAPFAPAMLKLAWYYQESEKEDPAEDHTKAIKLFERYASVMPYDPRPHEELAALYRDKSDTARAEAEYRQVIKLDPENTDAYTDLAEYLALLDRHLEALAKIEEGAKQGGSADEMFAELIERFYFSEGKEAVADRLAAAQPERMAKNVRANTSLAGIRLKTDRAREALPLLKKAISIDPNYIAAHNLMASAYRKLREWQSALAAADAACKIDQEDSEAHYHRACALARLGRKKEAIAALKRSIELSEFMEEDLSAEEDLKPLANLAEFKKLVQPVQNDDK